jgi:hypothetical protein
MLTYPDISLTSPPTPLCCHQVFEEAKKVKEEDAAARAAMNTKFQAAVNVSQCGQAQPQWRPQWECASHRYRASVWYPVPRAADMQAGALERLPSPWASLQHP